jgi:DNA-binding NtrC family response regulator
VAPATGVSTSSAPPARVLWIGRGSGGLERASVAAALAGIDVESATSGQEGLHLLESCRFDAVLACFPLEEWTAEELLEEIQRIDARIPVIIVDARATLADAVRLTRLGAWHYFGGGESPAQVAAAAQRAAEFRRDREAALVGPERSSDPWRSFLVGESRAMQQVHQVIRLVGPRRSTVLITGETGTGKEVVARAIHSASPRSHLPLVAVNCSALPENLLEAELFGHVKGAFTGAIANRVGRFEQAHRSTLFLDEISDLPLELQAKLLRVLQEREFQRLGSSETIKVDVRVLAATNVDLAERVRQGKFREDLYYRLNVVPLTIPPLRRRRRDIPLLVHHFIHKICRQEELPPREITPEALERLTRYDWPGNVRQLENSVETAIALSGDRRILYPSDFPLPAATAPKMLAAGAAPVIAVPDDGLDFEATMHRIELAMLEQALRKSGGNKKQAAALLGLKRTTFSAKWKSLTGQSRSQACGV